MVKTIMQTSSTYSNAGPAGRLSIHFSKANQSHECQLCIRDSCSNVAQELNCNSDVRQVTRNGTAACDGYPWLTPPVYQSIISACGHSRQI